MALKVIISPSAIDDLKQIADFVAKDNPKAALQLGLALIERVKALEQFPQLGRVVPEFDLPNVREIIHKPYRIVYRIREEPSRIEIVRFWHASRGKPAV